MNRKFIWIYLIVAIILSLSPLRITPAHALGSPQIISLNPGSPQPVGTSITIRASVNWDDDFRAIRICFGGTNYCQEQGSPDITRTFDTSGLSAGIYQIIVQVASKNDTNWSNPNSTSTSFELTGQQVQSPTNTPQPQAPPVGPNLLIFTINPTSATVGDQLNIHIKVNSSNPGATKLNVSCGGVSKIETSEVEFDSTWNTSGCPAGTSTVTVITRNVSDPNWTNPYTTSKSISLSATQVSSPTANLSTDSTSIFQGQCTYLHWSTSNVTWVDIDGTSVNSAGSLKVCPTVTKKYTLTAHGQGGDANRNITIIVTTQPTTQSTSPAVINSFQTGDVINIGGNIYVIINGSRRLIPNPDTLDALGISRSLINNRGYSDSDLYSIPKGADIPDVDIDSSGFINFKNIYFPNAAPIVAPSLTNTQPSKINPNCQITSFAVSPSSPQVPGTSASILAGGSCDTGVRAMRIEIDGGIIYELGAPNISTTWNSPPSEGSHTIRVEVVGWGDNDWAYAASQSIIFVLQKSIPSFEQSSDAQTQQNGSFQGETEGVSSNYSENNWFCKLWPSFSLCEGTLAAENYCAPQCVVTARSLRDDMAKWIPPNPDNFVTPIDIIAAAQKSVPFKFNGIDQKVRVLSQIDRIHHGDLVYWPVGCNGVPPPGHIGYVDSVQGILITIIDSNWGQRVSPTQCSTRNDVQIMILPCMKFISLPEPVVNVNISLPSEDNSSASPTQKFLDWIDGIISKLNQPIN